MLAEGINDCSATNSTQRVDVDVECADSGGGAINREEPLRGVCVSVCVCVFSLLRC